MDDKESQNQTPDPAGPVPAPSTATVAKSHRFSPAFLLRLWTLREAAPGFNPANIVLVTLSLVLLLLWLAIDWWEALPEPQFLPSGITLFPWYFLSILVLAALLRGQSHPK